MACLLRPLREHQRGGVLPEPAASKHRTNRHLQVNAGMADPSKLAVLAAALRTVKVDGTMASSRRSGPPRSF
ncbi:hypothetical protein PAHAL_4G103900 [Panicum hallii]|uniref:Uncharacterized protein n=1 Tax=Panicum hallii TaxID=206008 RepID=A0A2T8JCH1_9POAL|nr:hypothetical protein PAHAL_4G103900 [Panicum hallii]